MPYHSQLCKDLKIQRVSHQFNKKKYNLIYNLTFIFVGTASTRVILSGKKSKYSFQLFFKYVEINYEAQLYHC